MSNTFKFHGIEIDRDSVVWPDRYHHGTSHAHNKEMRLLDKAAEMHANNSPIKYDADAFHMLPAEFDTYWNELPWEKRDTTPRREAFLSVDPVAYTYGSGDYARTYHSNPIPEFMRGFWSYAQMFAGCEFELCFVNGYEDERNHLGWHADDSDSVDDTRPILVVSIGAEREIWFRDNERTFVDKLLLKSGSGLLMAPGMQDTHQHRIPKHHAKCGPRISFTFRGLAK
jgi:alkylated DNA repair dioxygenase AlkB